MLLALIEELGHEYVGLLDGASQKYGNHDPNLLLDTAAAHIALKQDEKDEDEESEDEGWGEDEDADENTT